MKYSLIALITCLCCALAIQAKDVNIKTVTGNAVFYVPDDMSLKQAMAEVVRLAQIDALNKAFGNTIGMSSTSVMTEESERFYANGFDFVRGEWIETIGEPEIKKDSDGNDIVLTCTIKGKARMKKSAEVDLSVKVLRNGTTIDCEANDFREGNKMYLHFSSPIDGYVCVCQYDPASNQMYFLLPYRREGSGCTKVEHDKEYVFFSKEKSKEPSVVDEYKLGCEEDGETNTLYIMFSPNIFSRPQSNTTTKTAPRSISLEDFNRWKADNQSKDAQFQVVYKNIIIHKNKN